MKELEKEKEDEVKARIKRREGKEEREGREETAARGMR